MMRIFRRPSGAVTAVVAVLLAADEIRSGTHGTPARMLAVIRPALAVALVAAAAVLLGLAVRAVTDRRVRRAPHDEPDLPYMPPDPPAPRHRPEAAAAVPEARLAPPPSRPVVPPGHVPAPPPRTAKQRPVRHVLPVTQSSGRPEIHRDEDRP